MRPTLCALIFSLAMALDGACQQTQETPRSQPKGLTQERPAIETRALDAPRFFKTTSIVGASFSADEKQVLFSSDQTGVFNAYKISVNGGEAVAVTHSAVNATYGVSMFPLDGRLLFTSDQSGNELNHLFVREEDGSVADLTPGERVKAQFEAWSGDDEYFYVSTNERDARYFDLYRYAASGKPKYHRERVFTNLDGHAIGAVSHGGRYLVNSKSTNNANSDLYLIDLRNPGNPPRHLTPHEGNVVYRAVQFTPDDAKLLVLTDRDSEFMGLWRFRLDAEPGDAAAWKLVFSEPWDVSQARLSRDGKCQVFIVNEDARARVYLRGAHEANSLPAVVPRGQVGSFTFSRSGTRVAFTAGGDRSPNNLYVWNLVTNECQALTRSLGAEVHEDDLVESEVLRFPSFDGLSIPAILYQPKAASNSKKVPAMLWIHGGPGGQSQASYNAEIQFLVNQGFAILAVNNRGSSGYGKTFYHLDDKLHGDADLKDCIWGRKYLETLSWIDAKRIGIAGGSYGGYMVAAALAFAPDAFDVGIDIFGVTNWVRTLESIPKWWEQQRQSLYAELGDPAVDGDALRAKSPLFHASKIRKPLLIIQGKNDPRVLEVESRELAEAVRKNGVPVEFVLFDDEGHGFRRKENRIRAVEAYLAFLNRYLIGAGGR